MYFDILFTKARNANYLNVLQLMKGYWKCGASTIENTIYLKEKNENIKFADTGMKYKRSYWVTQPRAKKKKCMDSLIWGSKFINFTCDYRIGITLETGR